MNNATLPLALGCVPHSHNYIFFPGNLPASFIHMQSVAQGAQVTYKAFEALNFATKKDERTFLRALGKQHQTERELLHRGIR